MSRRITIAYHGHCFDGMASAALLTRFLRSREGEDATFRYRGLEHQAGGSFVPPEVLDGDVNAVVDFRYTQAPSLHWFFDHHVTGVVGDEERAHLAEDRSGQKFFHPDYGSCCKLIDDVLRTRFGFKAPELAELVGWADTIDAARFAGAAAALDLDPPAMQLMTVVDARGDDVLLAPRIAQLAAGRPLAEVAADPAIRKRFEPLRAEQERSREQIRQVARCEGGVISFELGGDGSGRYHKFVPYWLFPESRYCVAVVRSARRAKVSVGSNPWAPVPRTHDIAALCARYGGGGHPVVGAVSLPPDQVDRARTVAQEIADELRSG